MLPNDFRYPQVKNGNEYTVQDKGLPTGYPQNTSNSNTNSNTNNNSNNNNNNNSNANNNTNNNDNRLAFPTFQAKTSYTRKPPSEEDEKFFKLAKEAIVHTASVAANNNQHQVDPTLSDLFMRLQYVSSPHGNPIKSGENIRVNDNGQLMIHEFYENFPNLNNDIFQHNPKPYALVGDNPLKNQLHEPMSNLRTTSPDNGGRSYSPGLGASEEERKYECSKCSMTFKRSSDLKRHEKQHLEIPPNICHLCGKGFARKDALKRHVGTATCKRNAEKQLYIENLQFLKGS